MADRRTLIFKLNIFGTKSLMFLVVSVFLSQKSWKVARKKAEVESVDSAKLGEGFQGIICSREKENLDNLRPTLEREKLGLRSQHYCT